MQKGDPCVMHPGTGCPFSQACFDGCVERRMEEERPRVDPELRRRQKEAADHWSRGVW